MTKWFDPIDGRWYNMPEPSEPELILNITEDIYEQAARKVHIANVWEALTATCRASQQE